MELTITELTQKICLANSFPSGVKIVFLDLNGDRVRANKKVKLESDVALGNNSDRLWFYATEILECLELNERLQFSEVDFVLGGQSLGNSTVRSLRNKWVSEPNRVVFDEMEKLESEFIERLSAVVQPLLDECDDDCISYDLRLDRKFAALNAVLHVVMANFEPALYADALKVNSRANEYFSARDD